MIGYRVSLKALETLIDQKKPGWRQLAKQRTDGFRKARVYREKSSIWSKVKPIYMELQGESKCAYCERKLESVKYGKAEQDVEHFRPKGNVRSWRPPRHLEDQGVSTTVAPGAGKGYYLLAYNVFNYAASCKPCNSGLKGDRFPIAGDYDVEGDDPKELLKERPYLIYPIGDFDQRPQDLIRFHGVSPQAVAKDGHDRHRALVTIEPFKLDDPERKNLLRDRAMIIIALHPQLEKLADGGIDADLADAAAIVQGCLSAKSPHTNCADSFKDLHERDRTEARAIFSRVVDLILSTS